MLKEFMARKPLLGKPPAEEKKSEEKAAANENLNHDQKN